MQWLNDWLKTIITIVLFAAFVDLLLPSNKMQRYVKVVLSLFILLTLLSPILDLFRKDWSVDKLLAQAEEKQAQLGINRSLNSPNNSLQAIEQQGQRLKESNAQQAATLAMKTIEEAIKESIRAETVYEAENVQITTGKDADGNPYIKSISALLHDKAIAVLAPVEGKRKPIATVKPINIQVRVESKQEQAKDEVAGEIDTQVQVQAKVDIKKIIGRNFGVPVERIDIRFGVQPKLPGSSRQG